MADPLLPALSIQDVSVQADRQQCKLIPTSEAKKTKKDATPWPVMQNEETALKEAKRRCHRTQPTEVQYLGQLVLIFGHYKWLLENDVGYANLVDKHVKEVRTHGHKVDIQERWLKDYLLKYVNHFPQPTSTPAPTGLVPSKVSRTNKCISGIGFTKTYRPTCSLVGPRAKAGRGSS
ncbi:uncharacterized protein [Branchiostoma lanceolatum]|uniref:uncharacterized protein isoform X2 n=1 Tax=Branchiostoma lanceolatum TaxID=7740 RepID=UPI003454C154